MAKRLKKIGKYVIVEQLETGNYALVYKAKDEEDRNLILKIAKEKEPELNQFIIREFQILSQSRHPNIVNVLEYDTTEEGLSYFTMEYVRGRPINECFTEFNTEFIEAIIQIINALSSFHNKGFVHSDIKPEHIIYNPEEKKVVLIDFGFAGITTHQMNPSGTIGYVAPEILKGIGADQRSDLYSLGVIIYETLAGKAPSIPYRPIKNIPELMNNTIQRLLSEEPNLRPTAVDLYEVFRKFLPDKKSITPEYEVQLPPTSFVEIPEIMDKLLKLKGETVIINGEVGSGKTRLLKELRYKYLFKGYEVFSFTGREDGYFHNFICNAIGLNNLKLTDKEDQFQIYAEITERLIEFAKERNLIILVDNLDNLNDYEIGLFRFIGHSIQDTNITLIGTTGFDQRIKELNFYELYLRPFSVDEVKALIDKTFFEIGTKDGDEISFFVDWLHSHTGGNPLFIVETLKALHNQEILRYQMNHWQVDTDALKEFKISENIEGVLSRKLQGLNKVELNLLKILCITDYPLESYTLNKIIPEFTVINLEILKILGLVREEYIKGKRFISLANQIIKMLVSQLIKKDERILLIKKIIEGLDGGELDEIFFPLLGRLYNEIGEEKKAYKYFCLSAKNAERINDRKLAIEYYTEVLEYSKRFNVDDYFKILLNLAELYLLSGENHKAIEYYNKCIESPMRTEAFWGLGKAYSGTDDLERAIEFLKKALSRIEKWQSDFYIRIANRLAYCYIYLKDFDEGGRIINDSIAISRKINNLELEAEALYYYATLEWFKNEYNKGKEICLELINFCDKNHLNKQSAYATNLLSSFYLQTGDIGNGMRYIDRAIKAFEEIKNLNALIPAMINKALLLLNSGDTDKAKEVFEKAMNGSLRTGNKKHQYICLAHIAGIFEEKGRFDKALELYKKALDIEPDSEYANYALSIIYYRLFEIDKAKSILEEKIGKKEEVLYLIGLGIIYSVLVKIDQAKGYIERGIDRLENGNFEPSIKIESYLRTSQFYYEISDFEKAFSFAQKAKDIAAKQSREYIIADSFIKIEQFRSHLIEKLDIESNLKYLKEKGFLYDYAYFKKLMIESIIEKGIESERIREIAEELESVERIFQSIGAELELQRVKRLQLKIYPVILRNYSKRLISADYLEIFSKLAELINSNLGDEDFVVNILDLVIDATRAERGAIFIKTEKGMEFVAGRNMDKKTIKDAGELSKTAIEEMDRDRIVFVPNALDDPRFNIRKSVLLNQIRSILCIPLGIGSDVIGAIYLDSRIIGAIFNEQDRDFLITVSKILASVIEKSFIFKNLKSENILLKTNVIGEIGAGYLISKSKKMKKIYQDIEAIAQSDAPVLITGETGTGKGMLARLIHLKSRRRDKKFISINCGAIPETLLESELFGHKKGAFTSAYTDKKGLLEEGEGGTIFLDEISNTTAGFQAKVLEALEEKNIRRLGETITRKIDVRFILATNKELEIEVEEGRFRQDLFFRINVFRIDVPPLRERIIDIPELAKFFLNKYCKEMGKDIRGFEPGVIERLKEYHWPGNVRELMNIIERAVTLARGNLITIDDIGFKRTKDGIVPLQEIEKDAIIEALNTTGWNKTRTAKLLGIPRRTLYSYLKRYSILK
ncbi:MAG: sigma 54-interacting transcriptional regulator, partial [candidate division WOR-3 bacterium]